MEVLHNRHAVDPGGASTLASARDWIDRAGNTYPNWTAASHSDFDALHQFLHHPQAAFIVSSWRQFPFTQKLGPVGLHGNNFNFRPTPVNANEHEDTLGSGRNYRS